MRRGMSLLTVLCLAVLLACLDRLPAKFILKKDQLERFDVTGQFVRVVYDDKTSVKDVADMRLYLTEQKAAYFDFEQKIKDVETDVLEIEAARSILFKHDEMIERWIDEAVLAGNSPLRLIHGKGTGMLGRGLQEYLRTHPAVRSVRYGHEDEGSGGVTIVELR